VWRADVIDCHSVQCSLVIDTQPCLQLTYCIRGPAFFLNRGFAWSKSGPANTAERIEVLFGVETWGPEKHQKRSSFTAD